MNFAIRILTLALSLALWANVAVASTIWSGPSISFDKPDGVDGTLPQNQDDLTPLVAFAHGDVQGLYNAVDETSFAHNFSPEDTEWGNGTTSDLGDISFTDWNTWFQGDGGPGVVGKPAVVHLITDDVYLDIDFTNWSTGHTGSNPGFAYIRSTPEVVPEPSTFCLLGIGVLILGIFGIYRRRLAWRV